MIDRSHHRILHDCTLDGSILIYFSIIIGAVSLDDGVVHRLTDNSSLVGDIDRGWHAIEGPVGAAVAHQSAIQGDLEVR